MGSEVTILGPSALPVISQGASRTSASVSAGGGSAAAPAPAAQAPAASTPAATSPAASAQPAVVNQVQSPSRPTTLNLPGAARPTASTAPAGGVAPLPASKAPDEGKTWGGPSSTQPLNFGHPTKNGKLFEMDPSGIPVWASSGKALTADQYAAMPDFQKKQIRDEMAAYARRPGVPEDRRLLEAFDAAMKSGSASRATRPAPGGTSPSTPAPVAPAPAAATPAAATPAAPATTPGSSPAPAPVTAASLSAQPLMGPTNFLSISS